MADNASAPDRLREIGIHPRGEAASLVAGDRVRGHGDAAQAQPPKAKLIADC